MSILSTESLSLLVTGGAVAFAVTVGFVASRITAGPRQSAGRWKDRCAELDQSLARVDSVFGAYPGLILVWEEAIPSGSDWGEPKVYGSTAALASLVRFAEPGNPREFARNVLDGIADHETVSGSTLRRYVGALRTNGDGFSATIKLPGGQVIEADGRPAGAQVVLWLQDASVRSEDARTAMSRFQDDKLQAAKDPVAFMDMMRRAPFPMWRVTGTGRIEWANDAYVKAVNAQDQADVLSGQIQLDEAAGEQTQAVLASNQRREDIRHVVVDGKRRSMSVTLFPISGGATGIAVDATETETLRETLTRHIRAHDETLNRMSEGVVVFSPDRKITFTNTAFAEIFALDPAWLQSAPGHSELLDALREKRRLPEQDDYRAFKDEELSFYTDWPDETPDEIWPLPDGRTLRLVRMRDPHGGLSLLFEDMTDRMTMQSRFNTLIGVQRATLDKLSEGIAVFGPDGRLKVSNASFAKLWDLDEATLTDEPHFDELIARSLRFYHDRDFWVDLKARTTDPSPEVRRHVTGEIKRSDDSLLSYLSRPLPDGATLIAWNDVTASRKAQTALIERAEAMEAADRVKSDFVGLVSYQLRTPLTTISGYADMLTSGVAGDLSERAQEYLGSITAASADLEQMINDILDITAIDADVLDLDLGDVDVHALLSGAVEYALIKAEDTQIDLKLSCPEDIGMIRADEKRLKQVMHNLLSNALRYTGPGGHIEIAASQTVAGVEIKVKDDGVGISDEVQPKVFETFQSTRGGAGLGLALVKRFVERHGGWTDLESEEGHGTVVTVYLPARASLENAVPELAL